MIETTLSMKDFEKYFDNDRLGMLAFPHTDARNPFPDAYFFKINLRELFKVATDWKINSYGTPPEDIVGLIAYGPAVQYPNFDEVEKSHKKYLLFGPEVKRTKKVPINPVEADFLAITTKPTLVKSQRIPAVYKGYNSSEPGGDYGDYMVEGGIHLITGGIEQIVLMAHRLFPDALSALGQGVPIFFDERLNDVQKQAGIKRDTPRIVRWNEGDKADLYGQIPLVLGVEAHAD